MGESCHLAGNLHRRCCRSIWVTWDLSLGLNNRWQRLNIAARSIYPKHSRAVIYLKLSFPDRCFLLLLLGSRPSLINANPGHLAFHYRHSGRKRKRAQHVHNNTSSHTDTAVSPFCVMLGKEQRATGWRRWWQCVSSAAMHLSQMYLTVQSNHPPTSAT